MKNKNNENTLQVLTGKDIQHILTSEKKQGTDSMHYSLQLPFCKNRVK